MSYSLHSVPVAGGRLAVGEWTRERDDLDDLQLPTVAALHGMTGNHRAWSFLADASPGLRIIAPDLRGRGRSTDLPGPYGLESHIADLRAILDWFEIEHAIGVGHSLGAFALSVLAARHPEPFSGLLLVDGGLPLAVPIVASASEHVAAVRGVVTCPEPLEFPSSEAYGRFWSAHPAMIGGWTATHQSYCEYETVESGGVVRWNGNEDALERDARDLHGTLKFREALETLTVPTTLVAAGRGLFNEPTGVYSSRQLDFSRAEYPRVRFVVSDTNHYRAVLSAEGAHLLANELDTLITYRELAERAWAPPEPQGVRRDGLPRLTR